MSGLKPAAFTSRFTARSNRLITEVEIFPAFLPGGTTAPKGKKYAALYDTGATNSVVTPKVVADLQLSSIGAKTVGVGGGSLTTTSHLVNFGLPNKVMFPMVTVAAMVLAGGIDALIGMDILGAGDFAVTHHGEKTTFSFCVPSRREIDFVKEVQNVLPPFSIKPAKNAPCHCGSGKKYKGCHGKV
jgi:hypothetical protein